MKKILNIVNSIDLDSNSERIIQGDLEPGLIMAKTSEFNRLEKNDKDIYMDKLMSRVKKITKPRKLLSVLLLLDHFMKTNVNF